MDAVEAARDHRAPGALRAVVQPVLPQGVCLVMAATPITYKGTTLGYHFTSFPDGEGVTCPRQEARLWWDDDALKPCVLCKEPTRWRRPHKRGAATHPACEGSVFDTVGDDLFADVVFNLSAALGVTEMRDVTETPRADKPVSTRPLGDPNAGCSVCGRAFSALWIAAGLWVCPAHSLIPIRYRRRWS